MKSRDWLFLGSAIIGVFLITRKASSDSYVADKLLNANPALLPITPTETNLNVMKYADYIWDNAIKYNISPSIIAAVIDTESSGNPKAIRQEPAIKDYSVGLMQILTGTAQYIKTLFPNVAYKGNPADLNDPKINIELGTAYLRHQLTRYTKSPVIKPLTDMIAAYNAGTARRNHPSDFVYVNSKGSTIVQAYVDKVVEKTYRYEMFFVYLYKYDAYQAKFPSAYWSFSLQDVPSYFE